MSTVTNTHSLGYSGRAVRERWALFVAVGVGMLVAGGIASTDLFAAALVSAIYIGAMMLVAGALEIAHAFVAHGKRKRSIPLFSGVFYFLTGFVIVLDPILASASISFVIGLFLCLSGISRILYGLRKRRQKGFGWIVGSRLSSFTVGALVFALWPGIGLWLLGSILTVDLVFQGCGFLIFGLALRSHSRLPRFQVI